MTIRGGHRRRNGIPCRTISASQSYRRIRVLRQNSSGEAALLRAEQADIYTRAVRERQASTVVAAVTGVHNARSTGERDAPLASTPTPMKTLNAVKARARTRGEPLPRRMRTAPPP
jgi:hypothetical protein